MDVEARLLLYTVVLGAGVGLGQLLRRRAWTFRVYMGELALLAALAAAALFATSWTRAAAWPSFWAFVAVAIVPSGLFGAARGAARSRRYGLAWTTASTGAALLGMPLALRREAALYGAMAAAERGDEPVCRRRLAAVALTVGIPEEMGGETLVHVLPAAARRRWDDVLAALRDAPVRSPPLLAVEARAAAETGDLPRALRACRDLDAFGGGAMSARSAARRSLLAAAGRAAFLEEAAERGMPVVAGPRGTAHLAIARAHEALGDAATASVGYAQARRTGRGAVRLDAEAGLDRCAGGAMMLARPGDLESEALAQIEAACRVERSAPDEAPLVRRAPFTLGAAAVTATASALVFCTLGFDSVSLVAAGALSKPLIVAGHEWWRLATTMLLHGSWFHLAMNLGAIVFVGIPLEARIGWARTAIVYVVSGLIASAASVVIAGTPLGVGASGAAMGLIGALAVLLLRRPALFGDVERRRWMSALGLTVAATLAMGIFESEAIDNTAHGAGFLAGALVGWALLPRRDERLTAGVLRRLTAMSLGGLMLVSGAATASRMSQWRGERPVTAGSARAVVPGWMDLRATRDGVVVASRAPLGLAVEIGTAPAAPDASLLVPAEDTTARALLAAAPTRLEFPPADGETTREIEEHTDATGAGLRLVTYRRGRAFALILVPLGEGRESEDDAAALRIGESLTDVE